MHKCNITSEISDMKELKEYINKESKRLPLMNWEEEYVYGLHNSKSV